MNIRCPHCGGGLRLTAADGRSNPAPLPVSPTIFGWPIDGSAGPPSEAQRRAAKQVRDAWANDGRMHRVDELNALDAVIHYREGTADA